MDQLVGITYQIWTPDPKSPNSSNKSPTQEVTSFEVLAKSLATVVREHHRRPNTKKTRPKTVEVDLDLTGLSIEENAKGQIVLRLGRNRPVTKWSRNSCHSFNIVWWEGPTFGTRNCKFQVILCQAHTPPLAHACAKLELSGLPDDPTQILLLLKSEGGKLFRELTGPCQTPT